MGDDASEARKRNRGQPTAEEQVRWYSWIKEPAIFVDHYAVDLWPKAQIVRFGFGEYVAKGLTPNYRVGIAMPVSDARRLLRSLTRIFEEEDERLAKMAGQASEDEDEEVEDTGEDGGE